MKKLKKEYVIVIVAIAAILVSVGILVFTNSASTLFDFSRLGASSSNSSTLILNSTREALAMGESITLSANQQVTWTSSNTNLVFVESDGKARGLYSGTGTATITATAKNGSTKKVTVYVGRKFNLSKNYGPNVTISPTTDNKSVYVTAKDNNTIDYAVIRENDSKGTILAQAYTTNATQLKIKLTKLPSVGKKLRYYVTTKDKSSNVSSYTFTVQNTNGKYTVNNGPQLENTNVKLMEVNNNKYLFFRFADSNGITKVQYSTNNKTYKTVNLTGEKYATYYIKLNDIPKDKEGVYTIYLNATDKGDNVTVKRQLKFKLAEDEYSIQEHAYEGTKITNDGSATIDIDDNMQLKKGNQVGLILSNETTHLVEKCTVTSSDESILKVTYISNGDNMITALKPGTAKITIGNDKFKKTITVKVTN